jgi:putative tryptophan/tyrosine transport system substrate-binding protein
MSKSHVLSVLAVIAVTVGVWFYFNKNNAQSQVKIPLVLFTSHPALNAAVAGVKSALQQAQVQVDEYNAQGDIAIALQIAKQCAAEEPPVMIGIATPAAQAVNKARDKEKTALGFAAVSDPHGAHLDTELNVIGVADTPPIEQLIETMMKLFPKITKIGVVYSPSEINSTHAVERLEKIIAQTPLKLSVKGINNTGMVKVAAQELIDSGVEIIYVPLDNFMVSSLSILSLVASQHKIPLISNDPALITQGITLSVGPDFEESGKQLGGLILDYLNGKEIVEPIQLSRLQRTVVNKELAQKWALDTSVITIELV